MKPFCVAARASRAFSMAPGIPLSAGVSTTSAPRAASTLRRSTLIDSGIVSTQW
jgi:hypothetical protein